MGRRGGAGRRKRGASAGPTRPDDSAEIRPAAEPSPPSPTPEPAEKLFVEDRGDLARLYLDLELPWDLALEILRLVRARPKAD